MIKFVGVHHRHQYSIAEVEDAIIKEMPEIVCVELPPDDYMKFLLVRFYLETEMKIAIVTACDINARVFLIDCEKEVIEKRLRKSLKIKNEKAFEKFHEGSIAGFLKIVWNENEDEYKKAQEILIKERDAIMAKKIKMLKEKFRDKKILCVVGHSHVNGIKKFLEDNSLLENFLKEREIEVKEPLELDCSEIKIFS